MAEPLHSIWRKGCVILSAILLSISSGISRKNSSSIIIPFKKVAPKFARGIESYVVYMVGDDT
jgi:6-phosphogluconate dehydrogenase